MQRLVAFYLLNHCLSRRRIGMVFCCDQHHRDLVMVLFRPFRFKQAFNYPVTGVVKN